MSSTANIILQFVILVIGFVLLAKGADVFVDGAIGIARRFGISELVIGLTVVAMGTSAPEAAVSIASALKGNADISIGNVAGSNSLNILIILGVTAVIAALPVAKSTIRMDMPVMIGVSVLFLLLGLDGRIGRVDGIIFWIIFILYLIVLFRTSKKEGKDQEESGEPVRREMKMWKALLFTAIGLVMIVLGSDFAVDSAREIARFFGVSERVIGLTIVAFGTSLPELFTSVTAAKKGSTDIAIGNIVGSNLFNILFVIGTSAIIVPIHFAANFRLDVLVDIGAAVLLWLCCFRTKTLKRPAGILMLAVYAGYLVYLLR